jgi:peptide-methionine (S)-S-oxide reductase
MVSREDTCRIVVEVLPPLTHYVRSDEEHQDRLTRCPEDTCHLPRELLHKYRSCS